MIPFAILVGIDENKKVSQKSDAEALLNAKEERVQRLTSEEIRSRDEEQVSRRAEEEQTRQEQARRRADEELTRQRAEKAKLRYEKEQARKDMQRYFNIFELPYSATFDDVKKKHRIMIKLYHPDKHSSDDNVKAYANNKAQELNNALNTLKQHFHEK